MWGTIRALALTVGLGGLGWSCAEPLPFTCAADLDCGDAGTCQPDGFCSFHAPGCESGQVYGDAAPVDIAGACVPVAGADTEPSSGSQGAGGTGSTTTTGGEMSTTVALDPDSTTAGSGGTGDSDSGGTTGGVDTTDGEASSGDTGGGLDRVTDGILVLYRFNAGAGNTVDDVSGVDPPLPLTILQVLGSPSWGMDGLVFEGAGVAAVSSPPAKVRLGIQATEAFTLEAWVTASQVIQSGPPRIVTLAQDPFECSVALLHGGLPPKKGKGPYFGDQYSLRVRSEGTSLPNGAPAIITSSIADLSPTHVLASRDAAGFAELWVDGDLVVNELRTGGFGGWPEDHTLAVGNDVALERPYAGAVHLVAIYDRALTSSEIAQNYSAGY